MHPFFALPRPLAIGHRGCAGEVPENTLASFARGAADGAVVIETDVHLTRDGVPVLIHDDVVARVTEGSGAVRDLSFAEVQSLDAGFHFTAPDGSTPFRGAGLRIPSLAEALAALPGMRFNCELKEDRPEIAERVLAVIRAADREALTLVTSGDGRADGEAALRGAHDRRARRARREHRATSRASRLRRALDHTPRRRDGAADPRRVRGPARWSRRSWSRRPTRTEFTCTCGRSTSRARSRTCSRSGSTA
jgi:glycerophosphoryl diester phosphodiesterase